MTIDFYKYQGTGNDFIIIDNRNRFFPTGDEKLVAFLCHRRFGIGADGLILLEDKEGFDFYMRYYNSDGKISSMCGNGGRCIVAFAKKLGIIAENAEFLAVDGPHNASIQGRSVKLQMKDVDYIKKEEDYFILDTGSPHLVKFVENLDNINVKEEGAKLRYSSRFYDEGINVNFVKILGEDTISIRTYERGVEDETYSCGTGVTAAALVHIYNNSDKKIDQITVSTLGGKLFVYQDLVNKDGNFNEVYLLGEVNFVYTGIFNYENNSSKFYQ